MMDIVQKSGRVNAAVQDGRTTGMERAGKEEKWERS